MKKIFLPLILLLCLILTTLCASAATRQIETISTSYVRVQLLGDGCVRVEEPNSSGSFEDRSTLMAVGRNNFVGVIATITEDTKTITATTTYYTVILKKNTTLANNAVEIYSKNGQLLWTYDAAKDATAVNSSFSVSNSTVAYLNYSGGSDSAAGTSAATAKQHWGSAGIGALIGSGGTIVISGSGYVGGNYTLNASTPVIITGKAPDGTDYRYTSATTTEECTGAIAMKGGITFNFKSNTLLQNVKVTSISETASTFNVTNGAKVIFNDGTVMAKLDSAYPHPVLNIDSGASVLYKAGRFSKVTGTGTLIVTETTAAYLNSSMFTSFNGRIVFRDGESLCGKTFNRHNPNSAGVCITCKCLATPDVSIKGFYSELPIPALTPDVVALEDYPRIITPSNGMVYKGSSATYSGYTTNNATDIYFFLPRGNAELLRTNFIKLTGRTDISDIKTFGSWYSRYQDWSATEYLSVIDNYRANNFPLDVLVVDTDWRAGTDGTGYTINTAKFPNMSNYLATARSKGVLTIFNDHTHYTTTQMLNPSELSYHTTNLQSHLNNGLNGWWYDRNWSYGLVSPYSQITFSTLGQVMYHDIIDDQNGSKRVFMMSNADWIRDGSKEIKPSVIGHRYGIQWTGDITAEALQLREELTNMVYGSAVGANPYISSDLGGFKRGAPWQQNTMMYTRWMQYGALSPVFRIHSTKESDDDINTKLPYYYSDRVQGIVRNYMNLRYNLLPLFYTLAHENYRTGLPIARRLDFHYPEHQASRDNTQYLLGEDLLVAPLWSIHGQGDDIVPASWFGSNGLTAKYYNSTSVGGTPVKTETVKNIDFEWLAGSPSGVNSDYFSAEYTGTITPTEDCYIGLVCDDGGAIYINGELFVDGLASGWLISHMNLETKLLKGESYTIRVVYYDDQHEAACRLVYQRVAGSQKTARDVFIPAGEWVDLFSGKKYVGPQTIRVIHPLETTPLFVRSGAIIPSTAVVSPIESADFEKLSLNIFKGGDGSYTLYEDDGETEAYKSSGLRKTEIKHTANTFGGALQIGEPAGNFTTDYTERQWTIRIVSDKAIKTALCNGSAITFTKIAKDSSAFPLAETGASPSGIVYEAKFTATIAEASTLTYSFNAAGDLNGDSKTTFIDIVMLLKESVKSTSLPNPAGDINGDGKVAVVDTITLLNNYLNK